MGETDWGRNWLRVPWTARRSTVLNIHWKGWCWNWNSNTLATWYEELTLLKRPWCWERLKVGGEGDDRGWDGWMVSPTQWIWVWVSSGSRWWTGRPGMLQSMGSQRLGHDWATELNWTDGWWNNGYFLFWILSDELLFIFFYVFHSFKYSLMSKHYFLKKKCYKLWTNWKESLSTAS